MVADAERYDAFEEVVCCSGGDAGGKSCHHVGVLPRTLSRSSGKVTIGEAAIKLAGAFNLKQLDVSSHSHNECQISNRINHKRN